MSTDLLERPVSAAARPSGSDRLVLICDDDARRAERWKADLQRVEGLSAKVEVLQPSMFAGALRALSHRRAKWRNASTLPAEEPADGEALEQVERATHLVIDYDLTPDSSREASAPDDDRTLQELAGSSGEDFAYLVRTLMPGRGLIVVNQRFQRTTFDLTLQRFLGTRADVNVSYQELAMPGLWTGQADGYRPWSWVRMIDVPERLEQRADLVDLDAPVLASLGLGDDLHLASFARAQLDPLGERDPSEITFQQFVLETDLGLTVKDRDLVMDDDHVRHLAAAAVGAWLEQYVLPAQNILIDAPHLLQRYPGVLKDENGDREAWNRVAQPDLDLGELHGALADAMLPASAWLDRPTWSWPRFNDRQLAAQLPRAKSERLVFCEDVSRFAPVDEAQEFVTDVPGPYRQRYVANLDGVIYVPKGRLE